MGSGDCLQVAIYAPLAAPPEPTQQEFLATSEGSSNMSNMHVQLVEKVLEQKPLALAKWERQQGEKATPTRGVDCCYCWGCVLASLR